MKVIMTIFEKNKFLVFNAILNKAAITRSKIATYTLLSKPTVSKIVLSLISEGLIKEIEPIKESSRRTNIELTINSASDYVIAIEISGNKIRLSIYSLTLTVISNKTINTYRCLSRDDFITLLAQDICEFINESGFSSSQLFIASVATIGIIDNESGYVIKGSKNLPQWNTFDLSKELSNKISIPVIVENNVKAALIGEIYAGGHNNSKNMMLLCLGAGVGSAFLIEGNLLRGRNNAAGEIGYMFMSREQINKNWQSNGALENYCSFSGLVNRYELLTGQKISGTEVFECCAAGDFTAKSLIDELSDYIAMSILNAMMITNPERVIIYGEICEFSHLFLERTKNIVNRQALSVTKVDIEISRIGNQSSLIGAAILGFLLKYPKIEFLPHSKI